MRRRVTWTDSKKNGGEKSGWLIEFIAASYNEHGEIVPFAIVEMDDGFLVSVSVGGFSKLRTVTPYKPHADWKPPSERRDTIISQLDQALSEVSTHACTKVPRSDSYEVCDNCVDLPGCTEPVPF